MFYIPCKQFSLIFYKIGLIMFSILFECADITLLNG